MRHGHTLLLILLLAASTLSAFTCAWIEILNRRAGVAMPRKADSDDGVKWRAAGPSAVKQSMEEQFLLQAEQEGNNRVLTESQRSEIAAAMNRAEADDRLRTVVSTWGIAQYLVAPLALTLSVIGLLRLKGRRACGIVCGVACITSASCVALMFYRGYFTSLGW